MSSDLSVAVGVHPLYVSALVKCFANIVITVMTPPVLEQQSHPAQGAAPPGGVTFYNPAQFVQVCF